MLIENYEEGREVLRKAHLSRARCYDFYARSDDADSDRRIARRLKQTDS